MSQNIHPFYDTVSKNAVTELWPPFSSDGWSLEI